MNGREKALLTPRNDRAGCVGLVFTSSRQFPRTRRAVGRLVEALDALLTAHPSTDAIQDQTWWLDPIR